MTKMSTTSSEIHGKETELVSQHLTPSAKRHLRRRHRKETRFLIYGRGAVFFALSALTWLLVSLVWMGITTFRQNYIQLNVALDAAVIAPDGNVDSEALRRADYREVIRKAMTGLMPEVTDETERMALYDLVSKSGAENEVRQRLYNAPALLGETLQISAPTSDHVDQLLKGHIKRSVPETRRKLSDQQVLWVDVLKDRGVITSKFNSILLSQADSRDPELAGVAGAVIGSVLIILIAFLLALPIGVGAALYLDEFAPRNRWTDYIEISINNLAAVPSIVFGLLGLAIFINILGFQRSIPVVGGMVLALRAFPTIVIATRSALQSVSPSLVDGALSLGASHTQAVFQQKIPLATPGILTGSIIAMAQVLGETAPLLMIGMVAFVTDVPSSIADPATALPVQIFLWSENAERAWVERTAAAILILLFILVMMNGFAIWLRNRLEKRNLN
ncbi:phosphate ABC transporter membrane protein 2 (PhoT family) [Litorimonas taeanensis]|uniref:Phosphate ABC transporter membrane protein 2 (PhoT family) n=1 Tax=Litorimonas taeanensis TaxID=568099 RepID=A0A420WIL7_9PROT|nr:PstA family ABC transporter permease [Litorimonas taeanensis]RKQ70765.1 phosphate ABC transporter membrane protein 2 (PhoT family) [Litorimonas taeanensis]